MEIDILDYPDLYLFDKGAKVENPVPWDRSYHFYDF